jgi:copper chaperone
LPQTVTADFEGNINLFKFILFSQQGLIFKSGGINMTNINLKIEGMSCGHCVMNVKKAVDALAGADSSDVSVGSASVTFDEHKTGKDEVVKAVQRAGYRVAG